MNGIYKIVDCAISGTRALSAEPDAATPKPPNLAWKNRLAIVKELLREGADPKTLANQHGFIVVKAAQQDIADAARPMARRFEYD